VNDKCDRGRTVKIYEELLTGLASAWAQFVTEARKNTKRD